LTADAITTTTRLLANAPGGVLTAQDSALGRIAVRDLAAGTVLNANMLEAPRTVRRGQAVTVALASGAVAVRVAGTALRDGALGERIPVRNLNSRRVVEGVIRADGLVEVASGRP
jgi:flagella basal body P-ring formation protein FlgA